MDYEKEASAEGWAPREDWKGDPEKWVDAEEFVRRGEEILPIVNAKNRKLTEQVEALKGDVENLKKGSSEFREFANKAVERETREKDKALADLEAIKVKAIDDADGKGVVAAEREMERIRSQPVTANTPVNPVTAEWMIDNPWYDETSPDFDEDKTIYADGYADRLARQKPHLVGGRAFLDALAKVVDKKFPPENPKREQGSGVENTEVGGRPQPVKGFDSLPQEAKDAYAHFAETIPGYTEEEYLETYKLGEGNV